LEKERLARVFAARLSRAARHSSEA